MTVFPPKKKKPKTNIINIYFLKLYTLLNSYNFLPTYQKPPDTANSCEIQRSNKILNANHVGVLWLHELAKISKDFKDFMQNSCKRILGTKIIYIKHKI